MKTKKSTKRALLGSVAIIALCLVMLMGTTFAWFTDTASTGVNKIESGTLKLKLEYAKSWDANGNPQEWGDTADLGGGLSFIQKTDTGYQIATDMKWEPGGTYQLQQLRVTNVGNLALKYKVEITGIQGDAGLNKAIDWTVNGQGIKDEFVAEANTGNTYPLNISGHMKETAGNEYQGKSITGITVTVVATQAAVEYDSQNNTYDDAALYPNIPKVTNVSISATLKENEKTVAKDTAGNNEITVAAGVVNQDTEVIFSAVPINIGDNSVTYELSLKTTDGNGVSLNGKLTWFKTNIGKNLTNVAVKHGNEPMRDVTGISGSASHSGEFTYNSATGELTICTNSFSPFEITYDLKGAVVNGVAYDTLDAAVAAAQNGDTVVLMEDMETSGVIITKNITLNLNGRKVTNTGKSVLVHVNGANVTITGNGTLYGGKGGNNVTVYSNKGADVTIVNGTYGVGPDANGYGNSCIETNGGKVTIQGGTFSSDADYRGFYYVLNQNNSKPGGILVSGGTFKNYDPSKGDDNLKGNFVADGYTVTSSTQSNDTWYTVVPQK